MWWLVWSLRYRWVSLCWILLSMSTLRYDLGWDFVTRISAWYSWWGLHFNFESTCTPNTLTESFAFFRIPSMLIVIFMLNFLGHVTKCINSYFSDTNFASCLRAQLVHFSWMPFRIRQFRSVKWPYVKIYISSTNSITEVRNPSSSTVFKSSAIKNRNRIEEIEDPCEIPILVVKRYDSPSWTLIVVDLSIRKLWIHFTYTVGILRLRRLAIRRSWTT